jgi:hypothetical protein
MESYLGIPFLAVDRYNSHSSDSAKATIEIQETWLEYLRILPSPFSRELNSDKQAASTLQSTSARRPTGT